MFPQKAYFPADQETSDFNYEYCKMIGKMILQLVNQDIIRYNKVGLAAHLTTNNNQKTKVKDMMGHYNDWKTDERQGLVTFGQAPTNTFFN